MRRAPETAPAALSAAREPAVRLQVELVTPLLGGGTRTHRLDERCWLRASAVKGALRFWWRASFGSRYDLLAAMREAERALFGAAAGLRSDDEDSRGPVLEAVVTRPVRNPTSVRVDFGPNDLKSMALFPAAIESAPLGQPGARAEVEIWLRDPRDPRADEVRKALALWLAFGGAGSRTRRAAGQVVPTRTALAWLAERDLADPAKLLRPHAGGKSPRRSMFSLAHLWGAFRTPASDQAERAWKTLLAGWKDVHRAIRQEGLERAVLGRPIPPRDADRYASPVIHAVYADPAGPGYVGAVLVTLSQDTRIPLDRRRKVADRIVALYREKEGYTPLLGS